MAEAAGREAEQGCAMRWGGGKEPPALGAKSSRWSISSECAVPWLILHIHMSAPGDSKSPNILHLKWDKNCLNQPWAPMGSGFPAGVAQLCSFCVVFVLVSAVVTARQILGVYSLHEKCFIFLAELFLFASRKITASSLVSGKSHRRRKPDNIGRRI